MDELKMERTIRETLKTTAEGLEAPDKLKTRIDFAIRSGEAQAPARRRAKWGKKAGRCVPGGGARRDRRGLRAAALWAGYSSTMLNQSWTDFAETAEYVQEHVPGAKYVASFSNGYTFDKGYEDTVDKRDDSGNTLGSFTGIMLTYEKNGGDLTLEVAPVQEEGEYTSQYDIVRTVADTEVHYRRDEGYCAAGRWQYPADRRGAGGF